ncbi:A118 family predicted phage portal protein [Cerasibacillus quisquiliarum]|uniref:Portal protein n=1 Tax=Cerasibacillus quisquiliarum TaxID=227865 RepID=A0A511UUK2_9BACI|nr:phage portal protein [Cerasibacillus quisquiliarum]MBB5144865.1 A118 family predicted phage portal protein [Cerasibacillus quisquiliarum]GEN30244.1 portal protein [Cerasibacillus quisquiliarum]
MFKRAINAVRRWLYNLGILKGMQSLENHKDIPINEEMYQYIDMWKQLYRGYHEDWHKLTYKTIEGTKERKMDTLNMAKVSSNEMASLVYNEKCEISIGDDKNATAEFINNVFKDNKFNKKFQDYLEYSFAMGGVVIKPYVENDKIKLSFVTADCFVPISWSNETIREGVFINQIQRRDKTYTHLEWHEWINGVYTVTNELYESRNGTDLGVPVPLNTLKEYENLEPIVGMTAIEKPLFVYFKPNTANNIDTQSPLGISLFANALDTMKAIDVAFDSFNREFRLGKKRIIVPEHMVKAVVDPIDGRMHRYFDTSDETYEALPGEMDDFKVHDISVELRVDEHIAAINAMLNLFAMQTGFSSGTFTFDGQSMKTATEVISEQSKTFKSKQSHEVIIEEGLKELIGAILSLAKQYSLFNAKDDYEVSIAFDDSIAEDKAAEIDKQSQMVLNGLQSKKRAIMKIQGVTEDEALEILQEIAEESNGFKEFKRDEQLSSILLGEGE